MIHDAEQFGTTLRLAREQRSLTLGDISMSTKVPRSSLALLEAGDLAGLPAHIFVRGFIRSYAKALGISDQQPLAQFDRAVRARSEAERAEAVLPVVDPTIAGIAAEEDTEGLSTRRGMGLAVFVIILLLIATITLSLLLRRPPPSGEGLSQARPAPASVSAGLAVGPRAPATVSRPRA
jgi:cytoskeleton protein RodZ